jgi:hypothetical protein
VSDSFVLEIPEMIGIPPAAKRKAQAKTNDWPAGTVIVSADSHMLERDCWHGKFPPELRDKEPRIEFKDGLYHLRRPADDSRSAVARTVRCA